MTRLIDANALIAEYDRVHIGEPGKARKLMEDAPTVDAMEVVRCKDCYLGENCTCVCCEDGEMVYCRKHHKHMDASAFCSDGWRE